MLTAPSLADWNATLTEVLRLVVTTTIAAAVAIGVLWVGTRAMRNARKGSHGAAAIGWVLLFLGFGIPPPPPPNQQVEDMNRNRRNERTGSDPLNADLRRPPPTDD